MGDTQFHFRVRCSGSGAGGTDLKVTADHTSAPLVLMVSARWYGQTHQKPMVDKRIAKLNIQKYRSLHLQISIVKKIEALLGKFLVIS